MKKYVYLWIGCLIGALALVPYIQAMGLLPVEINSVKLIALTLTQTAIFCGLVIYLSSKIIPKTDLNPFKKPKGMIGVIAGLILGVILFSLDRTLFSQSILSGVKPPLWIGILASLYGAINEEVILRLFLFSTLYFFIGKIGKKNENRHSGYLWMTNGIVALIFGIGHLPAAFQLIEPSTFETFRVLLLNGIPGLVFGWLYWSRGIGTAMIAHLTTDIMIHGLL